MLMEEDTMSGSDNIFLLLGFLPFILYLVLIVFGIYFVVKMIQFMRIKIELDRERNKQMADLIKVFSERNHTE